MNKVILFCLAILLAAPSANAVDKVVVIPLSSNKAAGTGGQVQYNNGGKLDGSEIYYSDFGETSLKVQSENNGSSLWLNTETENEPLTLLFSKKWAGWSIGMQKGENNLTISDGSSVSVAFQNGTGNVGFGAPTHEITVLIEGYLKLDLISGAPPAADCDETSERGRMKTDSATATLYLCADSGWVGK